MNVIFLSRRQGRPLTLHLQPRLLATAAGVLLAVSGLLGAGAYWSAQQLFGSETGPVLSAADAAQQEELRAMSARLAEMQARMMRIDALGEHLVEQADLKGNEFDFSSKPPMGGPEEPLSIRLDGDNLERRIGSLSEELAVREAQLRALGSVLQGRRHAHVDLDNSPVRDGYMTSRFGYRTDPFTGRTAFHGGIDFAGPEGSDVFSVADGVVIFAGQRSGYGNLVEINHGDGLVTRYAHARALAVKAGDIVTKDQLVAYMGSTGRSTGTHLHYEVLRNGKHIDPSSVLTLAKR